MNHSHAPSPTLEALARARRSYEAWRQGYVPSRDLSSCEACRDNGDDGDQNECPECGPPSPAPEQHH